MKAAFASLFLLGALPLCSLGLGPDFIELDRGLHHRSWGRVEEIQTPRGVRWRTNATVVELQGGLHRWDAEQNRWLVTSPRLELFQDGAVVRGLQYSVIFAPNLATPGAIDIQLPEGQRLTGHLVGLAYTQGTNSILVAEVKDCAAEISGPEQNILTFSDAFTDYAIDVQYVVERGLFSQSLILHERLKDPSAYGLTNAHLELLTEWLSAPQPEKETRVIEPAQDGQRALTDERISLGTMQFLTGKAFSIGVGTPSEEIPTYKSWEQIQDQGTTRTFLIEKIPWRNIQAELQKLPPPQASLKKSDVGGARGELANGQRAPSPVSVAQTFLSAVSPTSQSAGPSALSGAIAKTELFGVQKPAIRPTGTARSFGASRSLAAVPVRHGKRPTLKPIRLASTLAPPTSSLPPRTLASSLAPRTSRLAPPLGPAFCIDFELGVTTNFMRWKSDTTYYISGPITVTTNIFEPCVIKYAPTNSAELRINGPVTCLTDMYRPLTLTARDDHSLGEAIGTSALSGYYASRALLVDSGTGATDLKYVRIAHANIAIAYDYDTGYQHSLSHAQIVHCSTGVNPFNTVVRFRNVLMYDVGTIFYTSTYGCTSVCENLTFHKATKLADVPSGSLTLALTNCLLVAVTNLGTYSGTNNSVESSDAGVFQTVGAGSHYLAAGSTNRNAGTTNVNPDLLADLRKMTTYPPLILSNTFVTADTTLSPQAQRDTDLCDRGYHYSPMDYAICGLYVTNGTKLTISPGTTLGVFGAGNSVGLALMDGASVACEGTPLSMVQIALFNLIQEQATTNWSASLPSYLFSTPWWSVSSAPRVHFAFTRWSLPAGSIYQFYGWPDTSATMAFKDCQFHGGMFYSDQPSVLLTNCLVERVYAQLWEYLAPYDLALWNNLFYGGTLDLLHGSNGTWVAKDNLFDKTWIPDNGYTVSNNCNAYTFTNLGRLWPTGANDVVLSSSNITYETSWLGRFYLPTNLAAIDAASFTNAALAGFYHYTTATNQVKEATNHLDIAFHYLAVNGNGQPIDSDGDGVPDYLEDANGNSTVNSGETDWNNATDLGLKVLITRPKNGSLLP